MKICVSVYSRFHAFDLARELHSRGRLNRLITSYPKFKAVEFGIPSEKVRSLLAHELVKRAWWKTPRGLQKRLDPHPSFNEWFDRSASRRIPRDTDLYIGWSGMSERGLAVAERMGAVTSLERGSTHIEFQRDILAEEYDRLGVEGVRVDPRSVAKEKREYEMADSICVPTQFCKQTFVDKGVPAEKLIVTPYGVSLGSFQQAPKRDKVFRVIFVGGMSLRKGVHYLLQAFAELRLPDAELWLVGPATAEIAPYFKKYEGTFRHHGAVPQAKLYEYYSQCSVFAICSLEEGMATVQLQAMACGLPLLCTPNTGGGDLIEEGREGHVLPLRNTDALKEKILELYRDPDARAAMGQAAKRRVSAGYTWDDYGTRKVEAYEELLARLRGGRG